MSYRITIQDMLMKNSKRDLHLLFENNNKKRSSYSSFYYRNNYAVPKVSKTAYIGENMEILLEGLLSF